MTLADPAAIKPMASADRVTKSSASSIATTRDPRLDFFRGCVMFVILIAHTPGNVFALWIPARFGFSDATEVFVFCSGMASAIAFGKVFREQGLAMGAARVALRVWQVYWAHIALFLAIAATMAMLNASAFFDTDYIGQLNLYPFFRNPESQLPALLTLTYVPNYFDILPMYLVVLAMMPLVVALARITPIAAAAFVVALWLGANVLGWSLPAEPWSDRQWFFNPFGWQLIFFTGFAFMSGWLPAPPVDRRLIVVAALVVIVIVPLAYYRVIREVPAIQDWRRAYDFLYWKSDFGILRYVHFLALAYLAWVAVGPRGERLFAPGGDGALARIWRPVLAMVMKVGQQSLAAFISSMFLARLLGVAFDVAGNSALATWTINLTGFALLTAAAYGAGWFKSQPWRPRKAGP